ncbi:uncharacterized protein Z520_08652 [Fonsecaea multimorphosa CBS 102226]|uniref:Uncharacterized protein n=1 Tax=Fonsecaea multimorphosa CBS 102226 TaxID=1442371 RepID=A0A0D2JQA6_9EURO|nr:uncharacterized protein Z520_08652 [Fonsecaea multimorphosa CBS 102226]KIX95532.1 hypothetical protein Z520_08652 [Fonsecaea multimorphosa CBS 102226]OAL21378.1 hypothetical protein AYO22_08101 [Fonsecaea multimorphosa]
MAANILDPGFMPPPPPGPITIRQAIDDLQVTLNQIRRKLRTLIDWYIFPDVVPNSIQAYDPRLQILQMRLKSLSTIDFHRRLPYLIDNSDDLASQYLNQLVDQLLSSVRGIQTIFVDHYDRDLAERRPFGTIRDTLLYRQDQIRQLPIVCPSIPGRRGPVPVEDLRPAELGNFCPGALEISNHRDRGRIAFVEKKELNDENRRKLKAFGGAFLNWACPHCACKVRYHVAASTTSNIHNTDEIREHAGLDIQYRSSFLAKSHLYLPPSEKTLSNTASRRDISTSGSGSSSSSSIARYGCVFCFATGHELERGLTAFDTVRDFAEHLAHEHRRPTLPPSLLIHRYAVAVEGKTVIGGRWDLNFL